MKSKIFQDCMREYLIECDQKTHFVSHSCSLDQWASITRCFQFLAHSVRLSLSYGIGIIVHNTPLNSKLHARNIQLNFKLFSLVFTLLFQVFTGKGGGEQEWKELDFYSASIALDFFFYSFAKSYGLAIEEEKRRKLIYKY